ncbi:serine carboxypeptidase S28-domain-containing protein [Scleroderma citrinum]
MQLTTQKFTSLLLLISTAFTFTNAVGVRRPLSPQSINLWKLEAREKASAISPLVLQDTEHANVLALAAKPSGASQFPEQYFIQPIDHHNYALGTFGQRYWVSTRHYVPGSGGPVIILDGGETSGEDRIPFLDTGIVDILANATGGIGVVLEHRYYGKSIPVPDFSTDNLRWLNNDQAVADSAHFMANVKFPGIDEDLTSPKVPWIYYGGSYAGARSAHMKILYPELVFGAIASSAVTHATLSNWEYHDIIRQAADPRCSANIENTIQIVDQLLGVPYIKPLIKRLFGLQDLEHDDDFASVLEIPLAYWQAKNWDPAVGSLVFDEFCEALNTPLIGPADIAELPVGHEDRLLTMPWGLKVDFSVLSYARYIRENQVKRCLDTNSTVEDCFGTYNDTAFRDTSLDQEWRLWTFQVCTEWGYFITAPPDPIYPRIVSNRLTLDYSSKICRQAYPPGKHFVVPSMPNISAVNILGDFAIAADRLAFIDGEVDPWKPCTPHSEYAEDREDTILRPFKLIPDSVHHYDENGLPNIADEPLQIQKIHYEMIHFVLQWLKDFNV